MFSQSRWFWVAVAAVAAAGTAFYALGLHLDVRHYWARTTGALPAPVTDTTGLPPGPGQFISANDTELVLTADNGSQTRYRLAAETVVYTQTTQGTGAPALAATPAGATVLVVPADDDPTVAHYVAIMPPEIPGMAERMVGGQMVSHTDTTLTITAADGSTRTAHLAPSTQILSTVPSGTPGLGLSDLPPGSTVTIISGITRPDGSIDAEYIILS